MQGDDGIRLEVVVQGSVYEPREQLGHMLRMPRCDGLRRRAARHLDKATDHVPNRDQCRGARSPIPVLALNDDLSAYAVIIHILERAHSCHPRLATFLLRQCTVPTGPFLLLLGSRLEFGLHGKRTMRTRTTTYTP